MRIAVEEEMSAPGHTRRSSVDSEATIGVLDPATGEEIGRIPAGDPDAVDAAVAAAHAAQPEWASTAPAKRAAALKEAAHRLRSCTHELAELQTRENGKPIAESRAGVEA